MVSCAEQTQGGFGTTRRFNRADDWLFPFHMLSFWVTFVGFIVILAAIFFSGAESTLDRSEVDGYAPLSVIANPAGQGMGMTPDSERIFCVGHWGRAHFHHHELHARRGCRSCAAVTCWRGHTACWLCVFPGLSEARLLLLDRGLPHELLIPGGLYVSYPFRNVLKFPLHTVVSPSLSTSFGSSDIRKLHSPSFRMARRTHPFDLRA